MRKYQDRSTVFVFLFMLIGAIMLPLVDLFEGTTFSMVAIVITFTPIWCIILSVFARTQDEDEEIKRFKTMFRVRLVILLILLIVGLITKLILIGIDIIVMLILLPIAAIKDFVQRSQGKVDSSLSEEIEERYAGRNTKPKYRKEYICPNCGTKYAEVGDKCIECGHKINKEK